MSEFKRILLTGSAGAIGQCIGPALVERGHDVCGFDRAPSPTIDHAIEGDLTDRAALDKAMAGRDTLIHLAAHPHGKSDFIDELLQPNVVGLYHTMEAAKDAGVKRIILASTMQVINGLWRIRREAGQEGQPVRVEEGTVPGNYYGLTKVWAEHYGEMFSRIHEMTVFAIRIGHFPRERDELERMAKNNGKSFLSHEDAQRFFLCTVEAPDPDPRFAALYATSRNTFPDPEPARRLIGYEPQNTYPDGCTFST